MSTKTRKNAKKPDQNQRQDPFVKLRTAMEVRDNGSQQDRRRQERGEMAPHIFIELIQLDKNLTTVDQMKDESVIHVKASVKILPNCFDCLQFWHFDTPNFIESDVADSWLSE